MLNFIARIILLVLFAYAWYNLGRVNTELKYQNESDE